MVEVVVDLREEGSQVFKFLKSFNIPVRVEMLDICDYIVGDVCIERKTAEDYINSLIDGRLNNQLFQMSVNFNFQFHLLDSFVHGEGAEKLKELSEEAIKTLKRRLIEEFGG